MESWGEVCYDGGMSGKAAPVTITSEEREVLEGLAISRTAPYREVQRARLVLGAASGKTNRVISQETGLGWRSVCRTGHARVSPGSIPMPIG